VALVRRGTCGFYNKAYNAQTAGAIAVVLYNNQPGTVNPTVAGSPAVTIPVVMASAVDGNEIDTRLAAGPVSLTWGAGSSVVANATGNLISSFSAYGLSPDLTLKPDIGAPGGNIWSTYPLELRGYASLSGTSMSSPHVAGAVALLLEAKPGTKAADVRAMLQNTADPKVWSLSPGLGFLDNVHRQGAGMLDIDDAITSTVGVTPGKLSLGESEAGPAVRTLTIRNTGAAPATFNLSAVDAITTNRAISNTGTSTAPGPVPFVFNFGTSAVSFSQSSVSVPAGGAASVQVTIAPDAALADGTVYGGYVVMTPVAGGAPYRVPFAGYKGDYQAIQPLDGFNGATFPWLTKLANGTFTNQPNGATYTLQGDDVPYFLVHFNHHVQRIEFEIVNAATGQRVHPVFSNFTAEDYVGRNSTRQQFFSFAWDGTRMHDNGKGTPDHRKVVPNGSYKVNVRALKALGNPANPAHWQVWTSPVVTIARP
jgi:minor extracellular serine protease Vpr